jgi:hypothetical protein
VSYVEISYSGVSDGTYLTIDYSVQEPVITSVTGLASPLYQWSVDTSTDCAGVVNGTGFDGVTLLTIGGVTCTITAQTSTTVSFTMPSAEAASSPLHTAGAKDVFLVQPTGSATLAGGVTVTAWDFDTPATPTLWLDADAAYTGGVSPIVTWTNRGSTAAYGSVGAGASKPTWSATGVSSKPAAVFSSGTPNQITSAAQMGQTIAASAHTIVCVVNVASVTLNATPAYNNHLIVGDSSAWFGLLAKSAGGTPTFQLYNYSGTIHLAERTFSTGTTYVVTGRHHSGNIYLRLNLAAESAATASGDTGGLPGVTVMNVGKRTGQANGISASIGHIIIWNSVVVLADRERAIAKLKYFYGI